MMVFGNNVYIRNVEQPGYAEHVAADDVKSAVDAVINAVSLHAVDSAVNGIQPRNGQTGFFAVFAQMNVVK